MDPIWLTLFLPLAAGSGWFGATRALAKRRRREDSLPSAYFKGLNFLLNEQHDKALEVLVRALEQDKETVEVQLALGSLFRKRGEIQRATRVHQNLVARTHLNDSQKICTIFELGSGYGGTARTGKLLLPDSTMFLCDLPTSLFFSHQFISLNFPDSNILLVQDLSLIHI